MGALGCGIGFAGATITLTQIVVQLMQRHLDEASYREAAGDPLLAGLLAGVAIGAFFGIRRSRALENIYQRGVIGVLAAVGGLLVGFLAALLHHLLGLTGLILWAAASLALGIAGGRWATVGTGEAGSGKGTA
ncbi:MAG: hypothetical protein HYS40_08525 [Gemmatimonadetes bacterium]|nr:hypothetical protein [Gemmatimonadota bacterium]